MSVNRLTAQIIGMCDIEDEYRKEIALSTSVQTRNPEFKTVIDIQFIQFPMYVY